MRKIAVSIIVFLALIIFSHTPAMAKEDPYKLGPGDIIEISVWKDEDLTRQIIVPPDGTISFPLIEDIEVINLTVPELREIVKKKINEFLPDATVTVMLIKSNNGLMAYVIGKVNNPGQYPINMETSVMQLLSMASGLNPYASAGKIIIWRRKGEQIVKIPFDYDEVAKGENLKQNILIKRGDVIVVP